MESILNATIEVSQSESVPIGCSAASLIPYLINRQIQQSNDY